MEDAGGGQQPRCRAAPPLDSTTRLTGGARSSPSARGTARVRHSDVALIDFALESATITNMIDLALADEQSRLIQLDDEITKAAATALLPFRGVW